jgi:sigma-B regulation protein RsbU (phosphoserine phosphatase)
LRTVAARGFTADEEFFVQVDDPDSVAARVFRERRVVLHDPVVSPPRSIPSDRPYRGQAYLSVPICYASQGVPIRCIGVINLTDRTGGDRFTPGDRKLLTAIASQVGAAIENVRLAERDRQQQGVRRELELAHDLQMRLLPSPAVLHGEAQVAARCIPVDSVGGDFYTFSRLGQGRVAVMLGDVSSHGFGAALVMALVLSAAGIHVETIGSPEATLDALTRFGCEAPEVFARARK